MIASLEFPSCSRNLKKRRRDRENTSDVTWLHSCQPAGDPKQLSGIGFSGSKRHSLAPGSLAPCQVPSQKSDSPFLGAAQPTGPSNSPANPFPLLPLSTPSITNQTANPPNHHRTLLLFSILGAHPTSATCLYLHCHFRGFLNLHPPATRSRIFQVRRELVQPSSVHSDRQQHPIHYKLRQLPTPATLLQSNQQHRQFLHSNHSILSQIKLVSDHGFRQA